jgi:hypothetical protein
MSLQRLYQAVVLVAILSFAVVSAAQTYHLSDRWKIGGQGGWDYLVSDDAAHRLYIAHNSRVVGIGGCVYLVSVYLYHIFLFV